MINALADILTGALTPRARAIESTGGDMQTPAEITALAERVERVLRNRHLVPDEPVHVRIGNRPADLGSLLGIWRAGAVAVPVHVSAAASTLERLQGLTHARFSVDGDQLDVSGEALPPHRPLLRDAALVIFTSGSTGMPKGVVIGHRRLAGKLAALDRLLAFRPDDVVLLPLQLTFIFGIWVALLALMKGARLLLVPKFTIETIGTGLAQASILAGVPSMFRALLAESAPAAPNLRLLLTGGEVLAPKLARAMMDFSPAVIDLYGLTETGSCDFCAGQPQGIGTIGRATEGVDFRIAESGELQIRTPFGMLGYLDDPAFTVASFADGFFRTGDLARVTEGGYVELIGRAKDIISRGGIKIAPLEIDHLLSEHPAVAAALCAGVPDERLGEAVHAVVVRRAGADLDSATLRTWMLTRTERFKVPDVFYFRDALPSGPTGKADRRAVVQLAQTLAKLR